MFHAASLQNRPQRSRHTRRIGRFEALENRRLLAGEILSFHLNARTADDVTALTDASTRQAEVEVGQVFHLEISYEDLREPVLGEVPDFGAYAIGVDVLASLPDAIVPVLTETQRVLIEPSVATSVAGTIGVSLLGTNRSTSIELADFANSPNLALKSAIVDLGYDADVIDVTMKSNAEGFILLQVRYNDVSFAGIDLPNLQFDFSLTDTAGDPVAVNAQTETIPPILANGQINGAALRFNYDTNSRTYQDNEPFYDAINRGIYNVNLGFDEVNGVGDLLGLPIDSGVDRSQPFDVLSIPVYINREVTDLELSLNPAERFHSNLVFGSDEALTSDELEFDPANSVITLSAKGTLNDSPLRNFYFSAATERGGRGLYLSDGNTTRLIRDRFVGPDYDPQDLLYAADRLFFTAITTSGERELYVTDGTETGTRLVANISNDTSSEPMHLTDAGDRVYFTALRADGQRELYVTEGDFTSARAVLDLSNSTSSDPQALTVIGDQVYFSATNIRGERELYVSGGTPATTRPLFNLNGRASSEPADITPLKTAAGDDLIAFIANDITGASRQLYISDGTLAGTLALDSADPQNLTVVGSDLFFTSATDADSRTLFRTDGTVSGTSEVLTPDSSSFEDVTEAVVFDDELYFVGEVAGATELYAVGARGSETRFVRNIAGRESGEPRDLTVVNQRIAFTALLPDGTRELFRTNGTEETTQLVANLHGDFSASPESLTTVGSRLAFVATAPNGAKDLYFSDLSRSGTVLMDAALGDDFEVPSEIVEANVSKFQIFKNGTGSLRPDTVVPLDANLDGAVSARDALAIVNYLGRLAAGEGEEVGLPEEISSLDVNRDGSISALDALSVINFLSQQSSQIETPIDDDDDDGFTEVAPDAPTAGTLF